VTYVIAQPCVDVKDKSCIDNTEFFVEIGSPGGASKVGATGSDHQIVTALPPKSE